MVKTTVTLLSRFWLLFLDILFGMWLFSKHDLCVRWMCICCDLFADKCDYGVSDLIPIEKLFTANPAEISSSETRNLATTNINFSDNWNIIKKDIILLNANLLHALFLLYNHFLNMIFKTNFWKMCPKLQYCVLQVDLHKYSNYSITRFVRTRI